MSPGIVTQAELELVQIRLDGETQSRAELCEAVVQEYHDLMAEGVVFPPVRVWFDGSDYWLADGFHRVEAARRNGALRIAAMVQHGTLEDARWDSLAANSIHGLRRSKRDIQLIVDRALKHKRSTGMSVNQLSRHLGIPEPTLRRWIKRTTSPRNEGQPEEVAVMSRSVPALRYGHRLLQDLEFLRQSANRRETTALVNILDKWFLGLIQPAVVAAALDRLFQDRRG